MNVYETDDEEQDALSATYASHAHGVLFQHFADVLPEDDPWAEKVGNVLCDAMHELEALMREEAANRPGMVEAGRAWRAAFRAANAEFIAVQAEIDGE